MPQVSTSRMGSSRLEDLAKELADQVDERGRQHLVDPLAHDVSDASWPWRAARPRLTRRKRRSVSTTATPKGPRSTKALMAAAASGWGHGRSRAEVGGDLVRHLHLTHRRGLPSLGVNRIRVDLKVLISRY